MVLLIIGFQHVSTPLFLSWGLDPVFPRTCQDVVGPIATGDLRKWGNAQGAEAVEQGPIAGIFGYVAFENGPARQLVDLIWFNDLAIHTVDGRNPAPVGNYWEL